MDHSLSLQLSTDCGTDSESPQPQNVDPTDEISRDLEELRDLRSVYSRKSIFVLLWEWTTCLPILSIVTTETSTVEQLNDDSQADNTPEISALNIHVGNAQIQQNDSLGNEASQPGSTHVEQESSSSIELLIQASEITTVSKNSSVKSKKGKHSKVRIECELWIFIYVKKSGISRKILLIPKSNQKFRTSKIWWSIKLDFCTSISRLNIPHSSTEFNYRGQLIPVHTKQLCDVHKISRGEFGDVFSIVVKGSDDLPIAVKVCTVYFWLKTT